jgi:hypothetical protein
VLYAGVGYPVEKDDVRPAFFENVGGVVAKPNGVKPQAGFLYSTSSI